MSTLGLISVTYYLAIERVNAQSQTLKITTAKQDFIALDETVMSVVWQPGSARLFEVSDSGGKLCIQPNATALQISVADSEGFNQVVFDEVTGQIVYELPYSGSSETGLFLKGDSRTIANQSGAVTTQLSIVQGTQHPEIQLRYRPTVSCYSSGVENGLPVNSLRIYVVNLNASDFVNLYGKLPLRISCDSTKMTSTTYSIDHAVGNVAVTAVFNGVTSKVVVPITSTLDGYVLNVELVQCNVKVARSVL